MARKQNQRKNSRNSKSRPHLTSTYRAKKVGIRVAHHKHTGRRLPFYCTSYAALFFILIFTSVLVLLISNNAKADQQSGTVQLSGLVKGPPPDRAAVITYPAAESRSDTSRIEIRGTCMPNTYIEIYRKNIFAGMTACSSNGDFAITINLVPGKNVIIAKIRDSVGQYGPDSSAVVVFYNPPEAYDPLLIYTEPVQRGIFAGQSLKLDYEINGDEPPYTIAIDWGDGSATTLERYDKEGDYSSSHIFERTGQMTVRISGIGNKGSKASIQTVVVVHSQSSKEAGSVVDFCDGVSNSFIEYCYPSGSSLSKITDVIWPAIIIATLMTISFWVGEKAIIHQFKLKH